MCAELATPEVAIAIGTPDNADPVAELDLAYLTFHQRLASASSELAGIVISNLEHAELHEYAESEIAEAEQDRATLDSLLDELYPDADTDLNQLLALIEQAKMKLDLPAGEGGLESFASVGGIGQICQSDGPYDELYLTSAMDLAQQQIDLAQVAVVNSSNPDIVAFTTAVIDRETAAIGQLLTWQNSWTGEPATPAG